MVSPDPPCRTCEAWKEPGCAYVRRNDIRALVERGKCAIGRALEEWVRHYVRFRAPASGNAEEDLLQEIHVFLLEPGFSFPERLTPTAGHVRRWLRTVVLNRLTDLLRRERVIPKKRCGACLYFTPRNSCSRALSKTAEGKEVPNPHYEKELDPHTNPDGLVPPCPEFFWRYRRTPLEAVTPSAPPPGEAAEKAETESLLVEAVAELVLSGESGRRQAYVLREHFTNGRALVHIAEELGLSERTVRRTVQAGLAALARILKEKFGVTGEDLLS